MALVTFTGGARSGKSSAAQRLAQSRAAEGSPVTVVVFGRTSSDAEFADRIARHKAQRPQGFETVEVLDPRGWPERVPLDSLMVIDCLGTLLGLCMEFCYRNDDLGDAPAEGLPDGYAECVSDVFDRCVDFIIARPGDCIVVTNEVGDGIVPAYASARLFRDLLGIANRRLVRASDAACLCVAGSLIDLTACPADVRWPED